MKNMSKGENELLSPDFESGMLVGFADGLSLAPDAHRCCRIHGTYESGNECLPEWFLLTAWKEICLPC